LEVTSPALQIASPAVFGILRSKHIGGHKFDLFRSRDHLVPHMAFPIGGPMLPSLYL